MTRLREPSVPVEYRGPDPTQGPRVPPIARPLALAGAICTTVGLLAASGVYARWVSLPTAEAYEAVSIIAMLLVVYVGQPLSFAALLIVRRPWSREHPPCHLAQPVVLLSIATLGVTPLLALALATIGQVPQLAGACGCGPVLLVLGLLLWYGGMPTRRAMQRHVD